MSASKDTFIIRSLLNRTHEIFKALSQPYFKPHETNSGM